MVFTTGVRPHWWLVSVPMRVSLVPGTDETRIVIEILSSPWVSGDVFGFYGRYIDAFTTAVTQAGTAGP
jgi:hypothetical protein